VSPTRRGFAEKFAALQETDEFKFQQSLAQLQKLGVEVGQELIPVLAQLGQTVAGLVGVFTSLPDPVQKGLLVMVAMAAVAGPLAKGLSFAASSVGLLLKVARAASLDSFRLGLMGIGGAGADASAKLGLLIRTMGPAGLGAAAGGLAVLTAAFVQMQQDAERAKRNVQSLREELERGTRHTKPSGRSWPTRSLAQTAGSRALAAVPRTSASSSKRSASRSMRWRLPWWAQMRTSLP
jgi:hypothetical protein